MSKLSSITGLNTIGSLVSIVAFGIVSYVSFVSINNLIDDENWVTHTWSVIDKSDYLMKTVVDAETGQRGYIITGEEKYLEPYNAAISQIDAQVSELKQLTADNPVQQSNVDKLEPLIKKRLDLLDKNISLRKANDLSGIVANFDLGEGKSTMDQIRTTIDDIKNEEQQLLAKRDADTQSAVQNTKYAVIFGTIGVAIVVFLTMLAVNKKLAERQKLERSNIELQVQTQQLKEIDREKEEFAAMISHELKTPLIPISGYAELFLDGSLGNLTEDQKEKMQVVFDNSLRLQNLIQDILDARKTELGKLKLDMQKVSIHDIVSKSVDVFKFAAQQKGCTLENETVDTEVRCDPDRVLQVLNNIISNAVKFTPERYGRISINSRPDNGRIVVSVRDNGIGIPKDKQENLFKKFYQVDKTLTRKSGGTGLGLAISRGIIEAHGGKIWVESNDGAGTTVYFSLPRENFV